MLRVLSILLFCLGIFCVAQSNAQVPLTGAGLGAPGGGRSYTFVSEANDQGSTGAPYTFSMNIGTPAIDRFIVLDILTADANVSFTSVTVNGITLNQDAITTNVSAFTSAIFSGLVTSGSGAQNVIIVGTGFGSNFVDVFLYNLRGLTTNAVNHSASMHDTSTTTINVTAGDLMFATTLHGGSAAIDFSGSTQNSFADHAGIAANWDASDWTIISTNAAFSINQSVGVGTSVLAAATYR